MTVMASPPATATEPSLLNIAAHLPLLADRRPDRPAVIHPQVGAHLTFRQLNEECDRYAWGLTRLGDRKSTRLNSSHGYISYAVFCLKKKNSNATSRRQRRSTSLRSILY